jgi:5,10-methylenetetrahydrofolate reductase
MIFKILSPKKNWRKKWPFLLLKTKLNLTKNVIVTLVFEENAKLAKIAENCDHNNDPR